MLNRLVGNTGAASFPRWTWAVVADLDGTAALERSMFSASGAMNGRRSSWDRKAETTA